MKNLALANFSKDPSLTPELVQLTSKMFG